MPRRNLSLLLLTAVIAYACYVRGEQNPYARYVADGLTAIDEGSLERLPRRDLFGAAMQGMVAALRRQGDEHSQYLPEEEAAPLRTDIRQQFGGIGVRIGFEGAPPQLTIVGPPPPGSPAARASLLAGDQILAIDDQGVETMSMGEVLRRMRGDPGTTIRLLIRHEHATQPKSIELVREVIDIESILGDRRNEEGNWVFQLQENAQIAHIRIAAFGDLTAHELANTLEYVLADGAVAVVLDLRDNAGGSLDAAVAVCEMLLPSGAMIVETRGRGQALRRRYATTADGAFLDLPLTVVVNQNSASAAEIVAAALQDHGRAAIVGQRTFGKGTVQQLVPLASGRSLLKLTWASFWRPSGERIHRPAGSADDTTWGVTPDPGYQRALTADEYAAYHKYRTRRDRFDSPTLESAPDHGGTKVGANFTDEQLQIAVEYLHRYLDQQERSGGKSDRASVSRGAATNAKD